MWYLELSCDLADERDELLQVFGLAVLQHVLRGGGDEGQHLLLQADDHAVQEGAHGAAQHPPLDGAAQCRQEALQTVPVDLGAAALLHSLLVAERFAGSTAETEEEELEAADGSDSPCWCWTTSQPYRRSEENQD